MKYVIALMAAVLLAGLKTEVAGRLERLPQLWLRLAARRLPQAHRADQLEEWTANLRDIIHAQTEGLPVTRLVRGLAFAGSAWWGARRLARALDPAAPRTCWAAYWSWCWVNEVRVARWAADRGWPRPLCLAVGHLAALQSSFLPFWILYLALAAAVPWGRNPAVYTFIGLSGAAIPQAAIHALRLTVIDRAARTGLGRRQAWLRSEALGSLYHTVSMAGLLLAVTKFSPTIFTYCLLVSALLFHLGLDRWVLRRTAPSDLVFPAAPI